MSIWTVDWETWNYDENGKIINIFWVPVEFTVEAAWFEEAVSMAESRAAEELSRVRKRIPENFAATSNSVPRILGLKDENHHYYKLGDAHEVFGTLGQIRKKRMIMVALNKRKEIEMEKKKLLTQEQKVRIYEAIAKRTTPDDTPCQEVIEREFGGNEDDYLRIMAGWHNVSLD